MSQASPRAVRTQETRVPLRGTGAATVIAAFILLVSAAGIGTVFAATAKGGQAFLKKAQGVCVFSGVIKAGLGIGGEYGEGALRVGGKTVDYYSIASASIGFQFGAQKKDVLIVFLEPEALEKFRRSSGWKAGVDGSVVLIDVGAGKSIDTKTIKAPIVGFIVGQKGLMYNLTLEGSKISKLDKSK
jgi:lipid-binding SYLF domain-containing protein